MAQTKVSLVDLNSNELILDLDGDTTLHSSTDDQIDIKIAGADDFTFTAGAFNVLASSHAVFADSSEAKFGAGTDLQIYHDGTNSFIANKTGALKIATETSGIAITIGHTTSEVTVADNLTVTGNANIGGSLTFADGSIALADIDIDGGTDIGAAIVDADLFIVDDGAGGTNRKVTASRIKTYIGSTTAVDDLTLGDAAVTIATSSGNITIDAQAGDTDIIFKGTDGSSDITALTLDMSADGAAIFKSSVTAVSLDISGDVDIDGTTNLDIVDIDGAVDMASTLGVAGVVTANAGVVIDNITIDGNEIDVSSGSLGIDVAAGITLDAGSGNIEFSDDGTGFANFTNTSGNLIIKSGTTTAATFSGANVTFAGTVGSGAITSTGIVTGTAFTAGSAVLAEAELELLDGLTAGTAIASKVVTTDANIDTTGQRNLTISGELDAATLDISGNADIDGTTNLDVVDIDGAVDMASTLQVDGAITTSSTINGIAIKPADGTNFPTSILISNDANTGTLDDAGNNTGIGHNVFDALTTGDQNTAVGSGAMAKLTAGVKNTGFGSFALDELTDGDDNIAIGDNSLVALTTGHRNIAIGRQAADGYDTENDNLAIGLDALGGPVAGGEYNVAVGNYSLDALTSADFVTAVGYDAGGAITSGGYNTLIGHTAGHDMTSGNVNTAVGHHALGTNTVGDRNVAVGSGALSTFNPSSNTDDNNTAVGYAALNALTTGVHNIAIGGTAMGGDPGPTTENHNLAIGVNSMGGNIAGGEYNVMIGNYSGQSLTSADNSVAVGYLAGANITSGGTNTFVGFEAGKETQTGTGNTFIGEQSGRANTGSSNTGVGRDTLYTNTAGTKNVAIGDGALTTLNDTGGTDEADKNVAVGYQAGANVTTGFKNTYIGHQAGLRASATNANVIVGHNSQGNQTGNGANNLIGTSIGGAMTSGYYNNAIGSSCFAQLTTGSNNIAFGHDAGLVITTGTHNTFIGYKTVASANNETNTILIGHGDGINNFSSGGSNNIRLGKRTAYIHTDNDSASFSTGSDERWKKNIANNDVGLDFINELRTVTFNWKKHSELANTLSEYDASDADTPDDTKLKYGLIAQEVKAAMDTHSVNAKFEGWREDSSHPDDKQMVSNDAFVIPLIKAMQELSAKVDALTARVTTLEG